MKSAVLILVVALAATAGAQNPNVKTQGSPKDTTTIKFLIPVDTVKGDTVRIPAATRAIAPVAKSRRPTKKSTVRNHVSKGPMATAERQVVARSTTKDTIHTVKADTVRSGTVASQVVLVNHQTWWQENKTPVIIGGIVASGVLYCVISKKCGTSSHNEATATAIAVDRLPVKRAPISIGFSFHP